VGICEFIVHAKSIKDAEGEWYELFYCGKRKT
jgi:hypothetical protein